MKKVDIGLIPALNKGAENQVVRKIEPVAQKITYTEVVDYSYNKGHNVHAGVYLVKLLDIKCHNKNCYKMKVEILGGVGTPEVITGYAGRDRIQEGYQDLADCFADGVLHSKTKDFVGRIGFMLLGDTGWLTLLPRKHDTSFYPNFYGCDRPTKEIQDDFDEYSKRFE